MFTVLQPENATDVTDVDFSKCGANYCPQEAASEANSSSETNFEISSTQRDTLFGIYLVINFNILMPIKYLVTYNCYKQIIYKI